MATLNLQCVNFCGRSVQTLVTHDSSTADYWVRSKLSRSCRVIGLDIEWRPNLDSKVKFNNPVATLQLCAGNTCLIFQILHAEQIPASLISFLNSPYFTFVGVGIEEDGEKLLKDYGLKVRNVVDLRQLAVARLGRSDIVYMGLKALAREVLGWNMEKPKKVTLSRWDNKNLTDEQIQYACIDALVSFELGRVLGAPVNCPPPLPVRVPWPGCYYVRSIPVTYVPRNVFG